MGGGAWPFLVGGVICLVNSVNERDLDLLTSHADLSRQAVRLCGSSPVPHGAGGGRGAYRGISR
jgi:hypothetical protein